MNVWVRDGDNLIHADAVAGRGLATRLRGVTIYQRSGGRLDAIVTAGSARPEDDGWRLEKVSRFEVAAGRLERLPHATAAKGIGPDRFTLSEVDPDQLNFFELKRAIDNLRDRSEEHTSELQSLMRISYAVFCLIKQKN